jgi:hypothetical protein
MNLRQALLRAVLAAVAAMLVFAGPSFGVRGSASSSHGSLRDFSKATAASKPTAAQRAAVRALHAKATWNSYGTASTLMRPGGYLTKQASGATAQVAARSWLAKHKVIFRLASVRDLSLVADSKLTGGRGHAVTFQQSFGGLKVVNGAGRITVSMVPAKKLHRWKIGFASSTSVGTLRSTGSVKLSAAQAFVHAAGNLGLKTSLVNVRAQKVARGWTNLRVGGFRDIQRVRVGSYGLGRLAVPAYEAIVLQRSDSTLAFRTIVNARTGAILARTNLTDNFSTSRIKHTHAVQTIRFDGEVPGTDAACDVRKGPFTAGPGVRALTGFAAATLQNNDIVFNLFFGGSTTPLIARTWAPRRAGSAGRRRRPATSQVRDHAWASPRRTPHHHDRRHPRTTGLLGALEGLPSHPPAPLTDGPGESEHRHPPDVVLAVGDRLRPGGGQPRFPLAVGLRRAGERDHVHHERQQQQGRDVMGVGRRALGAAVHAGQQSEPRLLLRMDERLEQAAVLAGRSGNARLDLRRRRGDGEPVRDAQPDARFLVLPRVHRAELQRTVRELREHRGLPGGRPADRGRPVGPPVRLA